MKVEKSGNREDRRYGSVRMTPEGPFDITIQEDGKTQRYQRGLDSQAVEAFNNQIKDWGSRVNAALKSSVSAAGIKGPKLKSSIRNTYKYDYGEIYRIGFAFKREGVFMEKGVGRGYVMKNGVVVKISKSPNFARFPKPWFNKVIEAFLPDLEQIVVSYTETAIINTLRIYIR